MAMMIVDQASHKLNLILCKVPESQESERASDDVKFIENIAKDIWNQGV